MLLTLDTHFGCLRNCLLVLSDRTEKLPPYIPQILQTLLAESTTNRDIHILRLISSISVLPLAILRSVSTATRIAQQVFGCTRVAERFITLKYHQDIITQ